MTEQPSGKLYTAVTKYWPRMAAGPCIAGPRLGIAAVVALSFLASASNPPLAAQGTASVGAGDRVRVTTARGTTHDGLVHTLRPGALELGAAGESVTLLITSVELLEVHRGTRGRAGRGALIGALVSGVIGAVWARQWCVTASNCVQHRLVVAGFGVGLLPGALLGAAVGSLVRSDRWEEVPLERLRVNFAPQGDGRIALGFAVRF